MNTFLLKVLRFGIKLVVVASPTFPGVLELEMKRLQGKGTGGGSVDVEAKMALNFLAKLGVKDPVVLDIGANIGNYSEAILRSSPQARIFAFEPSSFARKELESRFEGNNQVTVVPIALGSSISTATLWSDAPGSGLGSLSKRRLDHFDISFEFSEQVQMSTLDSWSQENSITPNLIKMDVEGHELDVLKGAINALDSAQVIQFEFGGCNIDSRTFFQDFWYLLTQAGFAIFRISETDPIRILSYSEEDEYFCTTNYLAVKKSAVIK